MLAICVRWEMPAAASDGREQGLPKDPLLFGVGAAATSVLARFPATLCNSPATGTQGYKGSRFLSSSRWSSRRCSSSSE